MSFDLLNQIDPQQAVEEKCLRSLLIKAIQNDEAAIKGTDFQFRLLLEASDLDEIFKLRYQVFCHELQVLDFANFHSGKEIDEFDENCLHLAIVESS